MCVGFSFQWARDEFEGLFKQSAENAVHYLKYVQLFQKCVLPLLLYLGTPSLLPCMALCVPRQLIMWHVLASRDPRFMEKTLKLPGNQPVRVMLVVSSL